MPDAAPALKRELRLWDLVFFNITAVASFRWVAAAAHTGPGSISLWVLAIAAFFIPSALVVARLSERFPDEGGLYIWSKEAFGDWHGFLCAWFYFVSNVLFVPSVALAAVAISGFVWNTDPNALAQNRPYTLTATLILLCGAYLMHLFGLNIGKWAGNVGGAATYLCSAILAVAAAWIVVHAGSVTHFNLIPEANFDNLNIWSQIAFAFVGLELGPILGGEIVNPRVNVPRAAWISAIACGFFYIAGTSAILVVMKPDQVSQVTGLAQAGVGAGLRLGLAWFSPLFASMILAGTFGALASWIGGNTRLPFVIGLDHYLPEAFARLHPRWATPYVSLLTQAGCSIVLLAATQAGETITAAYQILVDMTVITTFVPFLYIFGAGWKYGQRIAAGLGFTISVLAIVLSAIPPPEAQSPLIFEAKVIGGCIVFGGLGWLLFERNRRGKAAR